MLLSAVYHRRVPKGLPRALRNALRKRSLRPKWRKHYKGTAAEHAFTLIVAVQPDPAAPFVPVADYNIIADPAEFAGALLEVLGK